MSKLEERIVAAEWRKGLADRWSPIVDGAGYLDGSVQLTPEDLLFLGGRIMRDKEVERLRMRPAYQVNNTKFPTVFETDWKLLFASMGEEGRAALRARLNFQPAKLPGEAAR
jgi:hypothetical protein